MVRCWSFVVRLLVGVLMIANAAIANAGDEKPAKPQKQAGEPREKAAAPGRRGIDDKLFADLDPARKNAGFTQLGVHQVWIDTDRKVMVADGVVCLTQGLLELFACPKGTKEHESALSLQTDALTIHAGLLAIEAETGSPVKYAPDYKPASGMVVDLIVVWADGSGKRKQVRAQEWVKNLKTKKPLDFDWVFAGSGFHVDEDTGERFYMANSGDLVCVSNFGTATLDLPVQSSQANSELMFEAFTENLPPKGTRVRLVFLPRVATQAGGKGERKDAKKAGSQPPAAKTVAPPKSR
ncbi:MAG: hypothetical protein FJ295_06385 [Planctomycetes bacterium]|nr:hypothetical protein [Planctomycetota bacterium]